MPVNNKPKPDPRALDVARRIDGLVKQKYDGDYLKGFNAYAKQGKVGPKEVDKLLKDANVGSWLTRGAYTEALIKRFDITKDGFVSVTELTAGLADVKKNGG